MWFEIILLLPWWQHDEVTWSHKMDLLLICSSLDVEIFAKIFIKTKNLCSINAGCENVYIQSILSKWTYSFWFEINIYQIKSMNHQNVTIPYTISSFIPIKTNLNLHILKLMKSDEIPNWKFSWRRTFCQTPCFNWQLRHTLFSIILLTFHS